MKKFLKRHKGWTLLAVLVIMVGGYFLFFSGGKTKVSYATTEVTSSTIVSSVSGTGQVSGKNQVDVKPLASGEVKAVSVQSGQIVSQGQTLIMLDQRSALMSLSKARASLASAQANYNKLLAGATEQDLKVSRTSVDSAKINLENSYQDLLIKMNSAYTQADDIVRRQTDNLFYNGGSDNPALLYQVSDMQPGVDAVSLRAKANTELAAWKKELGDLGMNPAASDLDSALQKGKAHLAVIKNFLNRTYDSLLVAVPTVNFPQSSITTAQGTVNSARSSVDQLISNLVSAGQAVQNSSTSLSQAQAALEQKEAPAETSDVESAKAQVLSAQAGVESAQIDYENTIVKAPFSGQIAVLDVQKGDQASPSAAVATIVGNQKIAEVTLNEVDVPNVQLGQRATLTFSAVDGLEIAGKVLEVENVGTANQGVVNYTVKIGFDTQDQRIKAGMSVTAAIVTSIKNDVLAVPNSAIKSMGQQHYVEVLDPAAIQASPSNPSMSVSEKEPERRMVEIGVSNDSQTEITSGLNPGELVVTQTVNSSQKTTASSNSGIRIPGGGFGR